MFKSKVYVKRRQELKEKVKSGILLFIGNDESQVLIRDTVHKFRQNSNYLYYWGLNEPGLAALIDFDNDKAILFGHDLTTEEIVWEGEQKKLAEKARLIGVAETAEFSTLKNVLADFRKRRKRIHYLPQHLDNNIRKISELLNISLDKIMEKFSVDLTKAVISQRLIKSKKEIAEIEKALKISYKLHTAAMQKTKPGKYEYEIVKMMEKILTSKGSRWAYLPIFTINGERLHNHHYGNKIQKGQLVLNDSGAESPSGLYSSDITRTFPVSGKFTKKQKGIYEIVLKSQLAAIKAIKPGVKYLDIHLLTARIIAEGLKKLGLMKGDVDSAVKAGAHALFFPHGLGHMMGLDVHDMEDLGENYIGYDDKIKRSDQFGLAYLRFAKELQVGHVITVEPGIYFIPQLIKQWQSENKFEEFINYKKVNEYIGFGGVRIEDNILVTKTGYRVLGKPIPKTVREIESLMKKKR
ncbi:MAG: M24 family metallopeptidase [Planctomycetia bacterium]|nr:M24 family metallopeptidase [Planctomycetia bacterium]